MKKNYYELKAEHIYNDWLENGFPERAQVSGNVFYDLLEKLWADERPMTKTEIARTERTIRRFHRETMKRYARKSGEGRIGFLKAEYH